ncbi:MAG: ATP-binding protein [Deltaproteobacteria bacterium]|nr:ATP-binding protein [Deltaproteobacteria bacterium]
MGGRDDALERLKAQLLALAESLPELVARAQAQAEAIAEAEGRPVVLTPPLINAETERRRLLSFAAYLDHYGRFDTRTVGAIPVHEALEQALALTRGEIEHKARLVASLGAAPLVHASPRQLGQVFVSLLVNAAQAIPERAPDKHQISVELDTSPAGWARIAIADTGVGISAEMLPQIFEPQVSTKRAAGMGMGLTIVREIMSELGGYIHVESYLGGGTLFVLELPAAGSAES